ncbi:PAAR domain-containing protein [Roseibium salinum]|nr:PAAR domain-containing protein [Roseibium salinum]
MHTCPSCAGVPAPIAYKCAYSVLTGKMPQARVTDLCVCLGPRRRSAATRSLQEPGPCWSKKLPAARMTDLTLKGGAIVSGFPTVLIGTSG